MAALRDLRRTMHRIKMRHAVILWIPGVAALALLWFMTRDSKSAASHRPPVATAERATPEKRPLASRPSSDSKAGLDGVASDQAAPERTIITAAPQPSGTGSPSAPGQGGEAAQPPLERGKPMDIQAQLDGVNLMLRDFRSITGENPVGTNAEIMKAMMGGNPRQATLGPPPGQRLNADGELLDPWGRPYFFHQLSAREMEIRSAGPDGQMWTDDDQIITSGTGAAPSPPR